MYYLSWDLIPLFGKTQDSIDNAPDFYLLHNKKFCEVGWVEREWLAFYAQARTKIYLFALSDPEPEPLHQSAFFPHPHQSLLFL